MMLYSFFQPVATPSLTGDLCNDFPGYCDAITRTSGNISSLYRLDAFDWTILILYFAILTVLAVYGGYRVKQVIDFWRYRKFVPEPMGKFAKKDLPVITVQLPLFNGNVRCGATRKGCYGDRLPERKI